MQRMDGNSLICGCGACFYAGFQPQMLAVSIGKFWENDDNPGFGSAQFSQTNLMEKARLFQVRCLGKVRLCLEK